MSEPLVLGFDTSAAHCAAALLCGDQVVMTRVEEMTRGQAERLMPLLEEILSACDVGWSDLDAIGVGIGPGNFTGIRISVSAARGLALSLGIPAVGVDGFEARSYGLAYPVSCLIPAHRDNVYRVDLTRNGKTDPVMQLAKDAEHEVQALGYALVNAPSPDVVENICRIAQARYQDNLPSPAPLYVKPADAAPARDPAPVILDDDA